MGIPNEAFNLDEEEISRILSKLRLKYLLFNPLHLCSDGGMHPYPSFNLFNKLTNNEFDVGQLLKTMTSMLIFSRSLYHNALAHFAINSNLFAGLMLNIAACTATGKSLNDNHYAKLCKCPENYHNNARNNWNYENKLMGITLKLLCPCINDEELNIKGLFAKVVYCDL